MPKKVLITGTFDIIHPGHIAYLNEARTHGDSLMVVIARDATVEKVKGYRPYFTETERVENLKNLHRAQHVLLGNRGDKLRIVEALKPDAICLGYDQLAFTENLARELKQRGLHPEIIRLKRYDQVQYKTSELHKNGLVAIKNIDPTIQTEPRYATTDNFIGKKLYQNRIILVRKNIADMLQKAQHILRQQKLKLKIWDGYRPLSVQKIFWNAKPDEQYIGNPEKGPFHTRAAAVDCTLVDARNNELPMPTPFDEFSERSHRAYPHPATEKRNMLILEHAMVQAGFVPFPSEWWHFSDPAWQAYPVLDISI
ncbi:MAG: M15 family metallopeptidase [Patescibacteria group bacterium]|nr:M15 family metallopeptidase [Patescibacteria group bacterium]MDD5715877.1 M15 family metallopeptidase [Patescibacteria group bacterium]